MRLTVPGFVVAAIAAVSPACGGGGGGGPDAEPPIDAAVAPAFRNPVDLPDDELAMQALRLLGAEVAGADRNCNVCHGLTRARLRAWETLSSGSLSDCLTDLAVTDRDAAVPMVDCLRDNPADATSPFSPARLGFYSIAAHLDWFEYLFTLAYPETGAELYAEFSDRVLMPRGGHPPYTQGEFDVIAEWLARGLPMVDELVPENPGGTCTPSISADVAAHVTQMETTGWHVVNDENGINLHGCAGAATPRDCLAAYPRAQDTTIGAGWESDLPGSVLRVLFETDFLSSFWTRSSADGRYVGQGGGSSAGGQSTIIDLQEGRLIGSAALYDPGFFPDNSGFAFQGGQRAYFCDQGMLAADDYVSYEEATCRGTSAVGLYQHLGAALGGGDYWTVDSQFVSDNDGHDTGGADPRAEFDGGADLDFVPLVHDGANYVAGTRVSVATPGEGDAVMSPSARLVVSRVAGANGRQNGYRLRRVDATPSGDTYTIDAPEIGRYCDAGGKPGISFDERWMAIHHYVTDADAIDLGFTGPDDPAFDAYQSQGAANIYLIDLLTGDRTRVTRMAPGQYALFPHFRSDGWMYFDVRIAGGGGEYIVASDALLLVGGQ